VDTREAITRLVFVPNTQQHVVDVAMVLGCPFITNMDPAIELYHKKFVKKLIISGRGPKMVREPEWHVYRRYGLDHGIPSSAIIIEPNATNTRENFLFSETILSREIGWSTIERMAIITSPVHTRRALMTARRYFPPHVALTAFSPSDEQSIQAETWWKTRYGRRIVLGELRRIGEYGLLGHLEGI